MKFVDFPANVLGRIPAKSSKVSVGSFQEAFNPA
jgi:hypothetical protein